MQKAAVAAGGSGPGATGGKAEGRMKRPQSPQLRGVRRRKVFEPLICANHSAADTVPGGVRRLAGLRNSSAA